MIFKSRFGAQQRWGAFVAIALLLASCTNTEAPTEVGSVEGGVETADATLSIPAQGDLTAGLPRLEGKATVEIMVNNKPVTVELDGE